MIGAPVLQGVTIIWSTSFIDLSTSLKIKQIYVQKDFWGNFIFLNNSLIVKCVYSLR